MCTEHILVKSPNQYNKKLSFLCGYLVSRIFFSSLSTLQVDTPELILVVRCGIQVFVYYWVPSVCIARYLATSWGRQK